MSGGWPDRVIMALFAVLIALLIAIVAAGLFAPQCSVTVISNSGRVTTAECPALL